MNKEYMNDEWFGILEREVKLSSRRKVAEKIGYSQTTVSLILNGKYAGKTDAVAHKVMLVYTNTECPFKESVITLQECRDYAHAPAPTHNPAKMQHWRVCQNCPKRPEK